MAKVAIGKNSRKILPVRKKIISIINTVITMPVSIREVLLLKNLNFRKIDSRIWNNSFFSIVLKYTNYSILLL